MKTILQELEECFEYDMYQRAQEIFNKLALDNKIIRFPKIVLLRIKFHFQEIIKNPYKKNDQLSEFMKNIARNIEKKIYEIEDEKVAIEIREFFRFVQFFPPQGNYNSQTILHEFLNQKERLFGYGSLQWTESLYLIELYNLAYKSQYIHHSLEQVLNF